MKVEIIDLPIILDENGQTAEGTPAKLITYILDPLDSRPNLLRPAIIICPGGGYEVLSDREAEPVALKYNAMGYHAFILKYHVAPERFPTALLEAASAVAMIRKHSKEWHVDPNKIIMSGFSAGGHLACCLGVFWNREFVYKPIGLQADDIKPNGMILSYPVITSKAFAHKDSFKNLVGEADKDLLHMLSLETQIGSHVPKTFLWHTYTDVVVPVENSFLLAMAMREKNISLEFHIYPVGKHGLSLANEETNNEQGDKLEPQCQSWITLAENWLKYF